MAKITQAASSFKSTKKAGGATTAAKKAAASLGGSTANSKAAAAASTNSKRAKKEVAPSSDGPEITVIDGVERRKLKVKNPKYTKHYNDIVADSLEGMDLLHADDQSKVDVILKLFDLTPEYGPAVGMTRLERWQRASNWGLDPPAEVYDILTTVEGESQAKYRESLFDGQL